MQTCDKKRKLFSLSMLKKPFSRKIQDRPVIMAGDNDALINSARNNYEKDKSNDTMSNRNRAQRLFRSIKKKLEKNKSLAIQSKVSAPRLILNPRQDIISAYERNHEVVDSDFHSLGKEHFNLAQYGWYWGPITKKEAEEKLHNLPNGSFLVRDSTSDHHFYTLSFRADSSTLHTRIHYSCGSYSLHEGAVYPSIAALIGDNRVPPFQRLVTRSRSPILHEERAAFLGGTNVEVIPVHLTFPVSRFNEVRTLQYLCRFVIRQYISVNNIEQLPVPVSIKGYLVAGHY